MDTGIKENKKIKIFVVGGATNYANWMQGELVDNIKDCDLVVFTGGEDVNPKYYNSPKHHTTSSNKIRDVYEVEMFNIAKELNKPSVGICRGAQLSCALSGGQLVQHQEHPGHKHQLITIDGKEIRVTSSHHQAQYPFNMNPEDYKILGWTKGLLAYHKDGNNDEMSPEVECEDVVYYKTKCLGIQSHPEWCYPPASDSEKEMIEYYQKLLIKFMNNEL